MPASVLDKCLNIAVMRRWWSTWCRGWHWYLLSEELGLWTFYNNQLVVVYTYRSFTSSVTYVQDVYYNHSESPTRKKNSSHKSINFWAVRSLDLLLFPICEWTVMEKKLGPVHWTSIQVTKSYFIVYIHCKILSIDL